ncbi:uncharacterized protein LOC144094532 isoform X2 [Amblyomma americanum]
MVHRRPTGMDYYTLAMLTVVCAVVVAATALLVYFASAGGARVASGTTVGDEPETVNELYYRHVVHVDPATTTTVTTGDSESPADRRAKSPSKSAVSEASAETESTGISTSAAAKGRADEIFVSESSSALKSTSAGTVSATTPKETSPALATPAWSRTSNRWRGEGNTLETHADQASSTPERSTSAESMAVTTLKETSSVATTVAGPRTRFGLLTTAAEGEARDEEGSPSQKGVLLCTAGDFAVEVDMLPPDGLCHLLFYTHVRVLGQDFQGRYNQKSWKTFRKAATASRKTGFGISASYSEADDMRKELDATGRHKLMQLHKEKIQHHGILRATGDSESLKLDLSGRLQLLNEFKKFHDEVSASLSRDAVRPELVLGILFTNYVNQAEVAQHSSVITELTSQLPITILVLRTHIGRRVGSTPVIGTLADELKGLSREPMNAPTLTGATSSLRTANITDDVRVLLSFTMLVGHFHLNQSFGQHAATWQAKSWTMNSFQETCRNNSTFDIIGDGTLRYVGIKDEEVFCFEDSFTMIEKARRVNFDYKIMRSWAAFDVEFEDYKNVCGKGAFHRLSELSQFLRKFM